MPDNFNPKYLYGPVYSWRLGYSLGIDLMSKKDKQCNFDCSYCQIGRTSQLCTERQIFVPTEDIINEIKSIPENLKIDFLTFSGRGEPTLAKNIGEVIKEIKNIRDTKIAIITNSTLLYLDNVRAEILSADVIMAKLDICSQNILEKVNNPANDITFENIVTGLIKLRKEFKGNLELQVMFLEENFDTYKDMIEIIKKISPNEIQINTPLRPCEKQPLSKEKIDIIKDEMKVLENYNIKVVSVYDIEKKKVNPLNDTDTLSRRGKEV